MTSAITTTRLFLRQWRDSDLAPFAALNADPEAMQYFPAVLDRSQSDAMASRLRALIAEWGWGLWAVEERASGQFIGFVGLHVPAAALPCSPCVEIGWRLAKAHWGRGLAREAATAALHHAFHELHLPEVIAFTSVHNHRSESLMQRLGMQRDSVTFAHPSLPPGHWLSEHCLYRTTSALPSSQQT